MQTNDIDIGVVSHRFLENAVTRVKILAMASLLAGCPVVQAPTYDCSSVDPERIDWAIYGCEGALWAEDCHKRIRATMCKPVMAEQANPGGIDHADQRHR
jgi:hypothetical protein